MSSYKDLQTKIFERDNYTCQYCGKSSREYRALVMAHIRTASLCGDDERKQFNYIMQTLLQPYFKQ